MQNLGKKQNFKDFCQKLYFFFSNLGANFDADFGEKPVTKSLKIFMTFCPKLFQKG